MSKVWEQLRRPASVEEQAVGGVLAAILLVGMLLVTVAPGMLRHFVTVVIALPLLGALVLAFLKSRDDEQLRRFALAVSLLNLAFSLPLWWGYLPVYQTDSARFAFETLVPWLPSFGISYHVGVDGVSLLLVLLTTLLSPIVLLSAWQAVTERVRGFLISVLLLEGAMIGVFVVLDLFLFYVFWEAMLIPMYFLIGIWGSERRIYATIKFVLFTMFGSLLMLVAILAMYYLSVGSSFDYLHFLEQRFPVGVQMALFLGFALAFAVKVPMWPLHTWLPDAHTEAPTAGSVILAGVLLKMGTYGFFRFCLPLFPQACVLAMPYILTLALIGIIYGAVVAMMQPDVKRLVAFSSVSHLGFVMVGLFVFDTLALQGSVLQMVNHGLSTGALFLMVGMLYERRHTRLIADFGGLWKQMPLFSRLFLVVTLASIGLPSLNGFIGEALIILGSFQVSPAVATLAATGLVLGALYMLRMYQRVCYGPVSNPQNQNLPDLSTRELAVLAPLVLLMFYIGLHPTPLLQKTEPSVRWVVERVERMGQEFKQPGQGRMPVAPSLPAAARAPVPASEAGDQPMAEGANPSPTPPLNSDAR